jgi:hypothetical protein
MQVKNRFQAFALHLSGSALVALTSAALVFLVWYPVPLAAAAGVTSIFLILLTVDVVVGPVITMLVFNLKKPELKRDLLIVLLLQLGALAYGLHTVFIARPVYLVFAADRFDMVYANEMTSEKLARVKDPRFQSLPLGRPEFIAAKRPADAKARADLLIGALTGGDDLAQSPQYYLPLSEQKSQLLSRLQPLDKLKGYNLHSKDEVERVLHDFAGRAGGVGYVPVRGKVEDLTAIVARDTGDVLDIVPLKPWE